MRTGRREPADTRGGQPLACVVGATGGLGRAFAMECAARGYALFLLGRDAGRLNALRGGVTRLYGVRADVCETDLTDANTRLDWLANPIAGEVSLLVINAGVDYEGPFESLGREQVTAMLRINAEAAVDTVHAVLALRARQESPCALAVLLVCSMNAYYSIPYKAVYGAAKAFLLHFARALRRELRGKNVTVTALCPSGIPSGEAYAANIASHGLAGVLTAKDAGFVARKAVRQALRGKPEYIPGAFNRALRAVSALLPGRVLSAVLGGHFLAAQRKNAAKAGDAGRADTRFEDAQAGEPCAVGPLSGRIFVVTGADAGAGLGTAREIAARGGSVIGVGRDAARCAAAQRQVPGARYLCADLSAAEDVRALARRIRELAANGLHGLVNNAGVYGGWRMTTSEGYERHFAVNYLAAFLLCTELTPLLANSRGCVAFVSPASHCGARIHWDDVMLRKRYGGIKAYKQSNLALVMLANRMNGREGVRFFAADAGTAAQIADLLQSTPPDGLYFKSGVRRSPGRRALDKEQGERLYELSRRLTGAPRG